MLFSYAYFLVDNYNDQIERQTDYLIRQLKEWILIELHPVNIQIFLMQWPENESEVWQMSIRWK
mgnify:CR=1 FL=1